MRYSTSFIIISSALILSNCATPQQNPIYNQSTQYSGSPSSVQQASVPNGRIVPVTYVSSANIMQEPQQVQYALPSPECLSKQQNRKITGAVAGGLIGAIAGRKLAGDHKTIGTAAGATLGGLAGHTVAGRTINCQVQPAPIPKPAAMPYSSETAPAIYTAADVAPLQQPQIQETIQSLGNEGTPGYYAVQAEQDAPYISTAQIEAISTAKPVYVGVPDGKQAATGMNNYTIIPGDTVYSLSRNSCISVDRLKEINHINDDFYIQVGQEITIPATNCVD